MSILTLLFFECINNFVHTGSDYLVNRQSPSSRSFTVTFQSKQATSTESVIDLAADDLVEGAEAFHLRIVDIRFIAEAANIFRAQDGLNNTVANVTIEDNDCKFMNTTCIICLQTVTRRTCNYVHVMHGLFSPTVLEVSWIISEPIEVTEGERDPLELYAYAFGLYATPIEIGVVCAKVDVSGVPPGADPISSIDTLEQAIIYHSSPICL